MEELARRSQELQDRVDELEARLQGGVERGRSAYRTIPYHLCNTIYQQSYYAIPCFTPFCHTGLAFVGEGEIGDKAVS